MTPPILQTALHGWHVAHRARMVPFAGWEMPIQYQGVIDEHRAVRSSVGLFDVSHMARFRITGTDALAVLEQALTNRVGTMKLSQVRYSLVLNATGGILDDILVYRHADHYAMVVNASNRELILSVLLAASAGQDVQIEDRTLDTTMIAVQGPRAVNMVEELLQIDLNNLKYYFHTMATFEGQPCELSRTGYTGEDGVELVVPNSHGVKLWEALISRGAVACGLGARDTLRLEAAMPLYGHELLQTIDPISAGLAWAVKLDKPFTGREALLEPRSNSTVRVGLLMDGKRAAREGSSLLAADSTALGRVTSGSYAPWLEQSIAMGYLPKSHSAVGTCVWVDLRGTLIAARVVPLPFYSRTKPTTVGT